MKETDQYEPTAAEKRILEVALNPDSFSMNIKERCKAAKTSKETWYKAMAKKPFTDLLNSLTMDMLKSKVSNVVNATYKFAISDSKCASDRKVLLTMAGLYTDKQEVESKNTNVNFNKDISEMSDAEIEEELKSLRRASEL